MKKVAILSAGPGLPEIVEKYGHSSEWIPLALSSYDIEFDIMKVYENDFSPILNYDAFIITGSKYSVYDQIDWIISLKKYIHEIVSLKMPVLGICFGHQILAESLGGKVVKNIHGWELGSYKIKLTRDGKQSPLFKNILNDDIFYESHQDVVSELPAGSVQLAFTEKGNQSFVYNDYIYGVQFHPEFTWEVTRKLMDLRIKKGISVDSNILSKSKSGKIILSNFIDLI